MNIKERLKTIGQNIFLVTPFLGAIFIIVGIKSTNTNWIFIGIGIVLLIPLLIYRFCSVKKNTVNTKEKEFQQFLKKADRVHVMLDDVKIKEKKHTETHTVVQDYRAAALNEITGNGHYNEEKITRNYCEVTFKVRYKGQTRIIKETIHKDETSVRMYFYMQKVTTFYVDPNDTNTYFLDLTFIEN